MKHSISSKPSRPVQITQTKYWRELIIMKEESLEMERRTSSKDRRSVPRESGEVRRKADEVGVEPERCETCGGYLYQIDRVFQCARPDQHPTGEMK